ncbi:MULTISPECIES: FixH family protein [unclassified Sphingobacterium]|uniref:FixH family protein n=1 Tax=unclassified Sphingobacterium TaxID=2609468 RepID=UPI0025D13887|nr:MULTISPECIES: FixH family protein [unclassified Sphingobacterium]
MNLSKLVFKFTIAFSIALSAIACSSKNTDKKQADGEDSVASAIPNESELISISDTIYNGLTFKVYADDKLDNKYHTIYLQVKDKDGKPYNSSLLDYYPQMDMGMMKHGAPFEHPIALGEGWYRGPMVFIMADIPDMGPGWHLYTILEKEGEKDTIAIKLPVSAAKTTRTMSSGTRDDSRVFVSNLLPDTLKQGKHPIKFLLNKMEDHHFPALDGYRIKLATNMPSMGHGSSGNKDAEAIGNGYYEGEVNFSMAGQWEIIVELWKDGKKANQDDIKYHVQVTK